MRFWRQSVSPITPTFLRISGRFGTLNAPSIALEESNEMLDRGRETSVEMRRQAAVVTAVGTDESGRPWCVLDESFLRPGDRGWVGPFELVGVRYSPGGQLLHLLKLGADPYVGELLALVQNDPHRPLLEATSDDEVTTQRPNDHNVETPRLQLAT